MITPRAWEVEAKPFPTRASGTLKLPAHRTALVMFNSKSHSVHGKRTASYVSLWTRNDEIIFSLPEGGLLSRWTGVAEA